MASQLLDYLEAQLAAAQYVMLQLVAGHLKASQQIAAQLTAAQLVAGTMHCYGNPISVKVFWELRGLSPNFHIHVNCEL